MAYCYTLLTLSTIMGLVVTTMAIPEPMYDFNENERSDDVDEMNQQSFEAIRQLFNEKSNIQELQDEVNVQKFTGMKVLFAYYGISCARSINRNVQHLTTKYAKGLCDGKTVCSGRVNTPFLTSPYGYGGCSKDFVIVAQCASGQIISQMLPREAHGKSFSLRCDNSCICA